MSDQHIELTGIVEKVVKDGFLVQAETVDKLIYCKISGKIRKNRIRILAGDKVNVKISVYDPNGHGIITFRH